MRIRVVLKTCEYREFDMDMFETFGEFAHHVATIGWLITKDFAVNTDEIASMYPVDNEKEDE